MLRDHTSRQKGAKLLKDLPISFTKEAPAAIPRAMVRFGKEVTVSPISVHHCLNSKKRVNIQIGGEVFQLGMSHLESLKRRSSCDLLEGVLGRALGPAIHGFTIHGFSVKSTCPLQCSGNTCRGGSQPRLRSIQNQARHRSSRRSSSR